MDFGEVDGIIDGKLVWFYYFCMEILYSDVLFIKVYFVEVVEVFCEGYVVVFVFLVVFCSCFRDEYGFIGGIIIVCDYVVGVKLCSCEVFILLSYKLGYV